MFPYLVSGLKMCGFGKLEFILFCLCLLPGTICALEVVRYALNSRFHVYVPGRLYIAHALPLLAANRKIPHHGQGDVKYDTFHSIYCAVIRQCILASIYTPLREQYILPDRYHLWLYWCNMY